MQAHSGVVVARNAPSGGTEVEVRLGRCTRSRPGKAGVIWRLSRDDSQRDGQRPYTELMLLSLDWDAYSGCRELVFDAPIWGSPDREPDRMAAWQQRTLKRDTGAASWAALDADFPLYPGWEALKQYAGLPASVAWSHAHAWEWLKSFPGRDVLNIDSHHDLTSLSGDPAKLRPGNWAGLGLAAGLISRYEVRYPAWHGGVPVAEGFNLARTRQELAAHLGRDVLARVTLTRADSPPHGETSPLPPKREVEALLLVQSPSWTSPAHDLAFLGLALALGAQALSAPYLRPWPGAEPLN